MKKLRMLFLVLILLIPCGIFWGCGTQVKTIAFTEPNKTILVDETYSLEIVSNPSVNNLKITYTISDKTIAVLLPDGKTVLGLKEGQTKIYAQTNNGIVSEMILSVTVDKIALATPTGITYNRSLNRINWINVLNSYSYEVQIIKEDQTETFEVLTNWFKLDDLEIDYSVYSDYEIIVKAKPVSTSKLYKDSELSQVFNFKQMYSVADLRYEEGEIVFGYESPVNLGESGKIFFNVIISKNNTIIANVSKDYSQMIENQIRYSFNFIEAGTYNVKVYATSENLFDSREEAISVIKLTAPTISTDEERIFVESQENVEFTYFKRIGEDKEEIGLNDLIIKNLKNGEQVIFEAYAHKQNSSNIYYINSEIFSLIVKRLETPTNVKLEKIAGDENSIRITWNEILSINDYDIYINDEIVNLTSYISDNGIFKALYSNLFIQQGIYEIYLIANKNDEDNICYLSSEKSEILNVVKLGEVDLEYDDLSNNFIVTSPSFNIGAILNIDANYNTNEFKTINQEIINTTDYFNLVGLDITEGICLLKFNINRASSDSIVYLDSEEYSFEVDKLYTPNLDYNYINDKLIISWTEIEEADYYSIQIRNLTDDELITHSGSAITKNRDIISVEINLLQNGKEYEIYVQALSLRDFESIDGTKIQYLNSDIATLSITKLASPIISILQKDIKSITFSWDEINGAISYDIYLDSHKVVTTNSLTYIISGDYVGAHSISITATSSDEFVIPSSLTNTQAFYFLSQIDDINYAQISDTEASISFNQIQYASGYILTLIDALRIEHIFTSYSLSNGKAYFNLIRSDYFNMAGEYVIYARAIGGTNNIVENERTEKVFNMLEPVSAIGIDTDNLNLIWNYKGTVPIDGYDIYINEVLVTDYEFRDIYGNIQMQYDISYLQPGVYNIKIIVKGDNISTIDSLSYTSQIQKKQNLASPTIISFELNVLEDFKLIFNEVEYASYYGIYICNIDLKTIYYDEIDSLNNSTIECFLKRSNFESSQLHYLFVRAFAPQADPIYANSSGPDFDNPDYVKMIYKSADVTTLELNANETAIDFHGYQAIINTTTYTNLIYTIPAINYGEHFDFVVRRTGADVDCYNGTIFYMAGDWFDFFIERLETPILNIGPNISWSNSKNINIEKYLVTIEFYGLGTAIIDTLHNVTSNISITYFEIVNLVIQEYNEELVNYSGNYKIYVKAIPHSQRNGEIYLSSYNTDAPTDFIIAGQLTNDLAQVEISPEGIIQLKIRKNDSLFIPQVNLLVSQGDDSANLILSLDGAYIVNNNSLNDFAQGFYSVNQDNDFVYLLVDIQQVLNDGNFAINWMLIGDETYSISAVESDSLLGNKLITPVLTYLNNEYGNYIIIDEIIYESYGAGVNIYAKYGEEIISISSDKLLIPHNWINTSNIYIYAIQESNNSIKSNEKQVEITLYDQVTDIRIWNNDGNDKTYLTWTAGGNETQWLVYIYYGTELKERIIVDKNQLELNDTNLALAGEYTFKVAAYGNNNDKFNSNFESLTATKLEPAVTLTNTNGILHWRLMQEEEELESYIDSFRIRINGNNIEDFSNSTYLAQLKGYNGLMDIQIRLIGNAEDNKISSSYTSAIKFYKYATPDTFKINGGWFEFDVDSSLNNLRMVEIQGEIYSMTTQEEMLSINDFYQSTINSGTAHGYIKGGEKISISGVNASSLNSDIKSIEFERLVISSDDETYLTQSENNGEITTAFNWFWDESNYITTRTAIICLQAVTNTTAASIDGWDKIFNGSGFLDYYYTNITVNYNYDDKEKITSMNGSIILPKELPAGTYKIFVQKNDSSSNGIYLASKRIEVINFIQLGTPSIWLEDGKIKWEDIASVNNYKLYYIEEGEDTYKQIPKNNNYELEDIFADLDYERIFNFALIANGNITDFKPVSPPSFYIISGKTSNMLENIVKPRIAGQLKLNNGGLYWSEELSRENPNYKVYAKSGAMLEFVFYNSTGLEIAKAKINANVFNTLYPNTFNNEGLYYVNLLDIAEFAQLKSVFIPGTVYTIKYRELGGSSFANSEYRNLINNSGASDGTEKQFKISPTITKIDISEKNGLNWRGITISSGDFIVEGRLKINYDIIFLLENGSYVYGTTIINSISISLESLKALSSFSENINEIVGIFVVVRGDDEKYISGFNSNVVRIKAIEGETALYVQSGVIKWSHVSDAYHYEIKTLLESAEIKYEIYYDKENKEYTINKYINGILNEEEDSYVFSNFNDVISLNLNTNVWSWDLAKFEGVEADTKYDLHIRYLPVAGTGIFVIPGEFTVVPLSVYKLNSTSINIIDGHLSWISIKNAEKYIVYVNYYNTGDILCNREFETINNYYYLDIEDLDRPNIKVAVRPIGPTGSINGIYYINPNIEYYDINCINRTNQNITELKDFVRNGDILEWSDTINGNIYEILIYSSNDNFVNSIQFVNAYFTSNKSFDLLSLNLDSSLSYKAKIRIRGISGEAGEGLLSSICLSTKIPFNVLNAVEEICIENGEIVWTSINENAGYKVFINSENGNAYVYTIVYNSTFKKYNIQSVTKNGSNITSTSLIANSGNALNFWPAEVDEFYSANVSIKAIGQIIDETYYLSSSLNILPSSFTKLTASSLNPVMVSQNENSITFSWKSYLDNIYDVYITNSLGQRIDISNNIGLTTNIYILNISDLSSEKYKFMVQRYSSDSSALFLKSNFKDVEFIIP